MDEKNEMTLVEDLVEQISASSSMLENLEAGSKERKTESEIYCQTMGILLNNDQNVIKNDFEAQKMEIMRKESEEKMRLERERFEQSKLEYEQKLEQSKLEYERKLELDRLIAESKAKCDTAIKNNEIWTNRIKLGLTALEVGASIGMGWMVLKVNAMYGGLNIGKDAKSIISNIKRIRI